MATSMTTADKQPILAPRNAQNVAPVPGYKAPLQKDIAKARQSDTWTMLTVIRIINAVTICTFFQPDEYYQALEPAWSLAFGENSGAWITWEWRHQLRSSLHPILLGGVYKAIEFFCDSLFPPVLRTKYLVLFPKIALAMQAVVMDYYTWALAEKIYGIASTESSTVLYLVLFSPWQWFVSTRAFSNTLETALTAVALYYWPWEWMKSSSTPNSRAQDTASLKWSIIFAAFASVLRPTNALIWALLSLLTLPYANQSEFFAYIKDASIFGSAVIGISQAADKWYYGTWTFPAANWVYFNLSENLAIFYGANRLDYYFTEGLAWLLMPTLPFALIAIYQALTNRLQVSPTTTPPPATTITRSLAIIALALPSILSLISHKEVRFIYPIFPILTILSAGPIASFFHPIPHPSSKPKCYLLYTFLLCNITAAIMLGYVQNSGVKSVHYWLRSEFEAKNPTMVQSGETHALNHTTLGVLMPCHSIPWRSHLVYPEIEAWALTCEPPIGLSTEAKTEYFDEADIFYQDPAMWLAANMGVGRAREWPEYLVFFGQLEEELARSVPRGLYEECWRRFNSVWHDDWRRVGDVVVWCRQRSPVRVE